MSWTVVDTVTGRINSAQKDPLSLYRGSNPGAFGGGISANQWAVMLINGNRLSFGYEPNLDEEFYIFLHTWFSMSVVRTDKELFHSTSFKKHYWLHYPGSISRRDRGRKRWKSRYLGRQICFPPSNLPTKRGSGKSRRLFLRLTPSAQTVRQTDR